LVGVMTTIKIQHMAQWKESSCGSFTLDIKSMLNENIGGTQY
jgi:hypothetical protein